MSELSIKVKIAGKPFPLTIQRDEEEMVRKAAKMVDDQYRFFSENYAVKDKADLLAMVALQMATAAIQAKNGEGTSEDVKRLETLRNSLQEALS